MRGWLQMPDHRFHLVWHSPTIDGTPDPFHVTIVQSSMFAIHADTNAIGFKDREKGIAGKLTPLIRIEYGGDSPLGDCFFKGCYAKLRIHRIGDLPRQYLTRIQVEYNHQIYKTLTELNVRDIRRPYLVRKP